MMRRMQTGDTIIEVTIAFAIFSLAAVLSMQILSKGVATTQRDLETTLVRQQVDAQAEMLRYVHDAKKPAWNELINSGTLGNLVDSPTGLDGSCNNFTAGAKAFILTINPAVVTSHPENTTIKRTPVNAGNVGLDGSGTPSSPYATLKYSDGNGSVTGSNGIWIQAAQAQGSSVKAYDFYIHACWDSVGINTPMTTGTIVRIYD